MFQVSPLSIDIDLSNSSSAFLAVAFDQVVGAELGQTFVVIRVFRERFIATQLGKGTRELCLKVRAVASAVFYDRLLDDDIRAARKLVL